MVNGFTFYHLVIVENQQIIAYRHQRKKNSSRHDKRKSYLNTFMGYLFNKAGNMLTNIYFNYFTSIATSQERRKKSYCKEFDAQIFMEISGREEKTSSENFSFKIRDNIKCK